MDGWMDDSCSCLSHVYVYFVLNTFNDNIIIINIVMIIKQAFHLHRMNPNTKRFPWRMGTYGGGGNPCKLLVGVRSRRQIALVKRFNDFISTTSNFFQLQSLFACSGYGSMFVLSFTSRRQDQCMYLHTYAHRHCSTNKGVRPLQMTVDYTRLGQQLVINNNMSMQKMNAFCRRVLQLWQLEHTILCKCRYCVHLSYKMAFYESKLWGIYVELLQNNLFRYEIILYDY